MCYTVCATKVEGEAVAEQTNTELTLFANLRLEAVKPEQWGSEDLYLPQAFCEPNVYFRHSKQELSSRRLKSVVKNRVKKKPGSKFEQVTGHP